MGVDRAVIVSDPGRGLEPAQARRFQEHTRRRVQREPVAYILGTKGFRTIELLVDGRVLIPRPETEHLVEAALDLPPGARVADVGTGSGAVALALKAERPDLEGIATDASADALAVARANAQRLGLDGLGGPPPHRAAAGPRRAAGGRRPARPRRGATRRGAPQPPVRRRGGPRAARARHPPPRAGAGALRGRRRALPDPTAGARR